MAGLFAVLISRMEVDEVIMYGMRGAFKSTYLLRLVSSCSIEQGCTRRCLIGDRIRVSLKDGYVGQVV